MGKSPRFLAGFLRGTPLLVVPARNSERILSDVITLSTKMAAPVKRFIFSISNTLLILMLMLNAHLLDYIATLSRSPMYALHGLAVRAMQCKVVLSVFELVC